MFDVKKYRAAIDQIKKSGTFGGESVKSKEAVYEELGKLVGVDAGTAKSWTRSSSNGPGDNDLIASVEKALDIPNGTLGRREERVIPEVIRMDTLNDYSKQAVHSCYKLMKEYIHDDEVEYEDCFAKMCANVDMYKVAIPEAVFNSIQGCIDKYLAPIVYEYDTTFAKCRSEELGEYDETEGTFHLKDEEATRKCCMYFMMTLIEIEEAVDQWAMENIYPLLTV